MHVAFSSRGGTRTPDTRIMIPRATPEIAGKYANSAPSAAPGAAVGAGNRAATGDALGGSAAHRAHAAAQDDAEFGEVIDRWVGLPEAIRAAILTLVRASG
jgi:hypothetical protein